ncbi:hypothetical protein LMK04_04170 [Lactococcus petauri]|jgi:cell division protein FtsB|nr:hypothetical protein LMK04_04170 [Lactococcus petauri]
MKKWIKQHPKKFKARGWKIVFSILVAYIVFISYGAFSPEVLMQDGGRVRQEIAAKVFYEKNKLISQQKLVDEASKLTPSRTKEIQQLESSLSDSYDRNTIDGYAAIQEAIWKKQSEDTEKSLKLLKQKNRLKRQVAIVWDTFIDINGKGAGLIYGALYH